MPTHRCTWSNIDLAVINCHFEVHYMFEPYAVTSINQAIIVHKTLQKCNECRWETWTRWKLFMRNKNKVFRCTLSKNTTIWVKQAALRLVDRLARDVPEPARKEGHMPFHRKLQSHMLCSPNGWLQFPGPSPFFTPFVTCDKIKVQTQFDANRFRLWMGW